MAASCSERKSGMRRAAVSVEGPTWSSCPAAGRSIPWLWTRPRLPATVDTEGGHTKPAAGRTDVREAEVFLSGPIDTVALPPRWNQRSTNWLFDRVCGTLRDATQLSKLGSQAPVFKPASCEHCLSSVTPPMAGPDPLLPWIAEAARAAREHAGRLQVHIAAERGMTEETIRKFEQARGWPRDPDAMIGAYAQDLDVEPVELWEDAIRRWRQAIRS